MASLFVFFSYCHMSSTSNQHWYLRNTAMLYTIVWENFHYWIFCVKLACSAIYFVFFGQPMNIFNNKLVLIDSELFLMSYYLLPFSLTLHLLYCIMQIIHVGKLSWLQGPVEICRKTFAALSFTLHLINYLFENYTRKLSWQLAYPQKQQTFSITMCIIRYLVLHSHDVHFTQAQTY